MTTVYGDCDFDSGTRRDMHDRLGTGWDLEQRRYLDILGDELSVSARRQPELPHEPLFDGVQTLKPGTCKAA